MKKVDGYWYPDTERGLIHRHARVEDVEALMEYVHEPRRTCVQAGGAAGVWPIAFSKYFDTVVTYEPNKVLYECLQRNLAESGAQNIAHHNIGLWKERGTARMNNYVADNMGAWHIDLEGEAFEVAALDDCRLADVDLIQLDIEGAEYDVLCGARELIDMWRPVVVLETKSGTTKHFGRQVQDLSNKMHAYGYIKAAEIARDVVWIPE